MGDSGTRRSTLVSRLPIFRRSTGKRQESLPSSPSSGNANGVHTSSSPSSTNSSSSSTSKRRSIFRTPSIGFHSKKSIEHKLDTAEPVDLCLSNGSQSSASGLEKGDSEDGVKYKTRHSFGFGGHRGKKITRSQTEDFERGKEQSINRNVFINCISSGTNEGDDSGFLDDYSKRASKHSSKKLLLPKSFSSHYRLSKQSHSLCTVSHPRESFKVSMNSEHANLQTPGSCPSETPETSLPSPLFSSDHTTAHTPSEFIPITEDTVSEADILLKCSPVVSHHDIATSDVSENQATSTAESNPLLCKDSIQQTLTSTLNTESTKTVFKKQSLELHVSEECTENEKISKNTERIVDSGQILDLPQITNSAYCSRAAHVVVDTDSERTFRKEVSQASVIVKPDIRQCFPRSSHTVGAVSSPFREIIRTERRLRSSSEGTAGSSRLHLNLKEMYTGELGSLKKQRTSSSSSKLDSLDVLNNLGSCELDEDDLMLDLDFPEDQRHRFVCREDSSQSISSCLAVMHSPMEKINDKIPAKEVKAIDTSNRAITVPPLKDPCLGERRPATSCLSGVPEAECHSQREDELVGLEAMPFRLMMQDCTSVKTLLLRLKRMLQESADMSPASSIHSLPVSPSTEKPLPFTLKDLTKEEGTPLMLQLKEKDDIILKLQDELEKAKNVQNPLLLRVDKSTQTEIICHDLM
ncbi:serine-rich coiled-coil domain-containing protein 1 isoform X2 [Erpetoichthys calabaricus]|uniref:serine-rich coiled-coil domain-containing protein 1 isoform X2 n=1 Tax=Erpetoichthys calabaricus TaxID=27687 RepID=UPI0022349D06|nr:serine-rich coiled-coil domain-containing protein 1 isoform X2 [Erpetoichthys calabaricus]